jgi:flagellar basal-body rod protein FlgG
MFDALQIAATGMHAQQLNVDTIANNLANVNTLGFKKSQLSFSDLVSKTTGAPTSVDELPATAAATRGTGVSVASVLKSFEAGEIRKTDSAYDVTIVGDGFFEMLMPDGTRAYARGGSLKVNSDGQLATAAGHVLKPGLSVPENAETLTIDADGRINVQVEGRSQAVEVGQLDLVRFVGPSALEAIGDNLYRATEASGEPIAGRAGVDGMGTLRQGYLESSNVKLVQEMVNLMVAQRAYEASVKVAQASDEMLGMVNNLRK